MGREPMTFEERIAAKRKAKAVKRAWHMRNRIEAKAKGLCYYCKHRKADEGFSSCTICREKVNKAKKGYREEDRRVSKQLGLCRYNDCLNEPVPGYAKCDYHLELCAQSRQKLYARRKADGLCPKCGHERDDHQFTVCKKCRDMQVPHRERRKRNEELKKQGLRLLSVRKIG